MNHYNTKAKAIPLNKVSDYHVKQLAFQLFIR